MNQISRPPSTPATPATSSTPSTPSRLSIPVSLYIEPNCWAGIALLVKEALAIAGTLHARSTDLRSSELFRVNIVAASQAPVASFTGPLITPDYSLRNCGKAKVIIVAPSFFTTQARTPISAELRRWLRAAYEDGALLLSLASGVRILAESGLLDGHEVTGNPSDSAVFAQHYPKIRFSPESPLVIDGRFISAATINPCLDACAYLVSQFYGEAAAHKFTRYTNSITQPSYERMALNSAPWKQHSDQRIKQAQEFIERHFRQDISVGDAARGAAMSPRNFSRRFQQAVGMSALGYISRCRVDHARELLTRPGLSILEVAIQCGFRNEITFRRACHHFLGQTPSQLRAQ